jgi:S-adenosylmethionine hydrolase
MTVISLTSDWNKHDYYVGMLKGRIMRLVPEATLVDISHDIQAFHSLQGAFVLRQAITEFPQGSIHLFLVNQGRTSDVNPVIYKYRGQFIIAWSDPVLGLLFDEDPEIYFQVTPEIFTTIASHSSSSKDVNGFSPSFPEMALFPRIIRWLIDATDEELNKYESIPVEQSPWQPVIQEGAITGRVIYVDSYKNAISNITRSLFDEVQHGSRFEIFVKSNHYRIGKLSQSYSDDEPGDLIALFNSVGFLEIAMVQGQVGELLSLEQGSTIKIKFYDKGRQAGDIRGV